MMTANKNNILITGLPGVGKTTLITKLAEGLKALDPAGFYTTEIRESGVRKGFELVSLDGRKGILSHVDIKSYARVGKYGVDIPGFEAFIDNIDVLRPETGLIIIDEIGKMECFSDKFKSLLREILDSDKPVVATIALKGEGIIADIKRRPDVTLFNVTAHNRESLLPEITGLVRKLNSNTSQPQ